MHTLGHDFVPAPHPRRRAALPRRRAAGLQLVLDGLIRAGRTSRTPSSRRRSSSPAARGSSRRRSPRTRSTARSSGDGGRRGGRGEDDPLQPLRATATSTWPPTTTTSPASSSTSRSTTTRSSARCARSRVSRSPPDRAAGSAPRRAVRAGDVAQRQALPGALFLVQLADPVEHVCALGRREHGDREREATRSSSVSLSTDCSSSNVASSTGPNRPLLPIASDASSESSVGAGSVVDHVRTGARSRARTRPACSRRARGVHRARADARSPAARGRDRTSGRPGPPRRRPPHPSAERHRLRAGVDRASAGHRGSELSQHLLGGLDGRHVVPHRDQLPRQLPRARSDVDYPRAGSRPTSHSTASAGYPGRARSYSSATPPNDRALA